MYLTIRDYPGVLVYFRIFDADDPSDDSIIDPNDDTFTIHGEDNYSWTEFGETASPLSGLGMTDAEGVARFTIECTYQPGDNYVAIGSLCSYAIDRVTQDNVDSGALPSGVTIGPVLTVWRRLYIERDSMAEVPESGLWANHVEGHIDSLDYDPAANRTDVDLGQKLPDDFNDENQFQEGKLRAHLQDFYVWSSTRNLFSDDHVQVEGEVPAGWAGDPYQLYDDDDFGLPCDPDIAKMADRFGPAYVLPVEADANYDDTVPFKRNITDGDAGSYMDHGRDLTSRRDLWVVRVIGAYQGPTPWDRDPDYEEEEWIRSGSTYDRRLIFVFLETIWDDIPDPHSPVHPMHQDEQAVVVHEVGHTFGLADGEGENIMNAQCFTFPTTAKFTEWHVRDIRRKDYPSH